MSRLYSLLRPVVAFREDTNAVVKIPAGALVELMTHLAEPVGVCSASWNGSSVMVFGEDVDSNGVSVVLNPRTGVFGPPKG
jgi:hypothetical protein